ncbi:MAG: hypothetical protein V4671_32275, partial [Armatimonadota bacterium]
SHSVSANVTLSGGLASPPTLTGYSCPFGGVSGGSLTLPAPPPGKSYFGSYSQAISPLQTMVTDIECRDMTGGMNTVPHDVVLYTGTGIKIGEQSNVTGSASLSFTFGGRSHLALFRDGTTEYIDNKSNYPLASDGVTRVTAEAHSAGGCPIPFFSTDPISSFAAQPLNAKAYTSFEMPLPAKGGGIRLRQKGQLDLLKAPWTLGSGGWQSDSASLVLSTTGTDNKYLRLAYVPGEGATPAATATLTLPTVLGSDPDMRVLPYRFLRLRFRSVGSANKPITVRLSALNATGIKPIFTETTGADGEWVEREIDVQWHLLTNDPLFDGDTAVRPFRFAPLYVIVTQVEITVGEAGTYEVEWLRGERKWESLASVMRANPATLSLNGPDSVGQGVRSLHGVT